MINCTLFSCTRTINDTIYFIDKHRIMIVNSLFLEKYTPQRSGLRERKRPESPKMTEPSVTENWIPEEMLELWEIKMFGEK